MRPSATDYDQMNRGTIIVAGSLAQRVGFGGHMWVFLQYLLGFKRLGREVLFLDELPADTDHGLIRTFAALMQRYGLDANFSIRHGDATHGVARGDMLERVKAADVFLNVMGYVRDAEILAAARCRTFLDIDPGFGQMWRELEQADIFAGHDQFVTVGLNYGAADCTAPTCGLHWITSPPPVVLAEWPAQPLVANQAFTSVASWRGPFGPIDFRGRTYGLRVHEFRKFFALPAQTGAEFSLALDIHEAETRDLAALIEHGWRILDPIEAAGDTERYRAFVRGSAAEFIVAKNLYVDTNGGWFSDRSACYLASGRPVLAQRTGWQLPEGRGLLGFSTLAEAAEGVRAIRADYGTHARAARELAEEYFDSDKVLTRLLCSLDAS